MLKKTGNSMKKIVTALSIIGVLAVIILVVVLVVRSFGNTSGKLTSTDPVLTAGSTYEPTPAVSGAETSQNTDTAITTEEGEVIVTVENGNGTNTNSSSDEVAEEPIDIEVDVTDPDASGTEPMITDSGDGAIELPFVPADGE